MQLANWLPILETSRTRDTVSEANELSRHGLNRLKDVLGHPVRLTHQIQIEWKEARSVFVALEVAHEEMLNGGQLT